MKKSFTLLTLAALAAFTLSCGSKDEPEADKILSVDKTSISATAAAGSYAIIVTSNLSWDATVSEDAKEWCNKNQTNIKSGNGNDTIFITVDENLFPTERVATITIKGGTLSETVTLTQAAAEHFTMTANLTYRRRIDLRVQAQSLLVDWGDGSSDRYDYAQLVASKNLPITHNYPSGSTVEYTITAVATTLRELECNENYLTSLAISGCSKLTTLICYGNNLTNLDVSKCIALENLSCAYNNKLTNLDVSKNTALETLWCNYNGLTNLDVSKNTALRTLWCSDNQLTNLDVSKNAALETLECDKNQLTNLDVSKNPALETLRCYHNQLTNLDVSNNTNTALFYLLCYDNQLSADALNALFTALPVAPASAPNGGRICIFENPGENTCNKTIAMLKGWNFITMSN